MPNFGMQPVAHIKDKSPARIVIVGKEHPAGGHGIFRVMYELYLLIGGDSSDQMSIRRRRRVGIDHREKVVALVSCVAGPGKQIVPGCCRFLLLAVGKKVDARKGQGEGKKKTRHVASATKLELRGH